MKKLQILKEKGIDPYPALSRRDVTLRDARDEFTKLSKQKKAVTLAGRVMLFRAQGGLIFFELNDGTGQFQALLKKDEVSGDIFQLFVDTVDVGDFVELEGSLFTTKRGEKTILVSQWRMLSKSLLPLPEKWHGLHDVEERLRRRYLDLIADESVRELFVKKSNFWKTVRDFLLAEGGLEVETPVLERIPGGADAEPFVTHLNSLDMDLYLRISPELPLKRLLVGGYDKVFEIGRIFRNEGIDREHLQDYTQMEMYWAYYDCEKLMVFAKKMLQKAIKEVLGSYTHEYQGDTMDWSGSWAEVDYYEAFKKNTGLDLATASEDELKQYAHGLHIDVSEHTGRGRLIDVIFKKKIRPTLVKPCFLVYPPVDLEPLAKRLSKDPSRVDRFQIVAGGSELGKGFSELNDPVDQRARFEEQVRLRKAGDKEAQMMDEDFVEALEYGMPPAGGFAISERFFAFLMNRPVRETVFFPLMRPK